MFSRFYFFFFVVLDILLVFEIESVSLRFRRGKVELVGVGGDLEFVGFVGILVYIFRRFLFFYYGKKMRMVRCG